MAVMWANEGEVWESMNSATGNPSRLRWVYNLDSGVGRCVFRRRSELTATLTRLVFQSQDSTTTTNDVTLLDCYGSDVLDGLGANLAGGTTTEVHLAATESSVRFPIYVMQYLTLRIVADSAVAGHGVVDLYFLPGIAPIAPGTL